jgi:hypothetical protein
MMVPVVLVKAPQPELVRDTEVVFVGEATGTFIIFEPFEA